MEPLFVLLLYPVLCFTSYKSVFAWEVVVLKADYPYSSVIFHSFEYCKTFFFFFSVQLVCLFSKNAELPHTCTVYTLPFCPSLVLGLIAGGKDVRICLSWAIQYFCSAVKLINNLEIKSIYSLIFITVGFACKSFVLAFASWVGKHGNIKLTGLV